MIRAAAAIDECAEAPATMTCRRAAAYRLPRAATRALRLAMEPPLTKVPCAEAGKPAASASQRSAASSASTAVPASRRLPPKIIAGERAMSAIAAITVGAPGMNARKRGWSGGIAVGKTTSRSSRMAASAPMPRAVSAGSASAPVAGGRIGPPVASRARAHSSISRAAAASSGVVSCMGMAAILPRAEPGRGGGAAPPSAMAGLLTRPARREDEGMDQDDMKRAAAEGGDRLRDRRGRPSASAPGARPGSSSRSWRRGRSWSPRPWPARRRRRGRCAPPASASSTWRRRRTRCHSTSTAPTRSMRSCGSSRAAAARTRA